MDKPKMITQFALERVEEPYRRVFFWADALIAENLRAYGNLGRVNGDYWSLNVDGRYNFNEVVAYLESLDTPLDAVWKDARTRRRTTT